MLGREIGSYQLIKVIGQGGMGVVYLAEHPNIKKTVAIKILNPEFCEQPEAINRFFQEAKVVNEIRHENVIDVLDFGRTPKGEFYIIMEYLEGVLLQNAIQEQGPFSAERIGHIGLQLCAALSAVHAKGVIHRDLKSENVFLTRRNNQEDFVKVLDFGIAKLANGRMPSVFNTAEGQTVGTPLFMSPEQALGDPVDAQSDLYSLGVVLYQMATNSFPFFDLNPIALGNMHINQPVPLPRRRNPKISAALESVILRCLAKKKEDRYLSAGEVALALGAACGLDAAIYLGQKPLSTMTRLQRIELQPPKRRGPPLTGWIFSAIALGLIGGLTFYIISMPSAPPTPTTPAVVPSATLPTPAPAPASTVTSAPAEPSPTSQKANSKTTNKTTNKTTKPTKKVTNKTTLNPFKNK